jgi:hypothetical protein
VKVLTTVLLVVGVAAGAGAQQPATPAEAEQIRARQKIFMMEGVLERAVNVGIDTFRRQLLSVMPEDMLLVTGEAPQARGFRLDGYGVFFDVEVPQVRPSLAWSLRTMNETASVFARDFERMRALVRAVPDRQQREELERYLVRMQQQVAPPPPALAAAAPVGGVSAQSVPRPPAAAPPTPQAAAVMRDPGQAYTEAVASALMDAMLENSGSLIIAANEFLTVAARDNAQANRFLANDPSEVMTLVLRVKGSDIADFQARRLTLDEVRTRVEVRAF